jgi:hypothetical protein
VPGIWHAPEGASARNMPAILQRATAVERESEEQVDEQIRATIADVNAPIELSTEFGPIEVLLVSREQVVFNDLATWNSPSVYLLISRRKGGDAWAYSAYVGQSTKSIARLKSHAKQKKDWHRACVIRKAGTGTFSSSQIAWLEGKIWSLISSSEHGVVANSVKPGDDTLQEIAVQQLESLIPSITNMLRLAQVDITPAQDGPSTTQRPTRGLKKRRTSYAGTLDDLMKHGLISEGEATYLVIDGSVTEAQFAIRNKRAGILVGSKHYTAPSAASYSVRGTQVNGWYYWKVKGKRASFVSLGELRAKLPGGKRHA